MRVAIIGAGLAGLACAVRLQRQGHTVLLFDKGRGPGGRMSSRRVATPLGEASFDHGAQYFTVRDAGFRAQVEAWRQAGLVAAWPAAGAEAWVGCPAMNAPVKQLANEVDVRWGTRVDQVVGGRGAWRLASDGADEGVFDATVLAVPAENAAPLLADAAPALAVLAIATPADPCWTVIAAFDGRLPSDADVLREDGPIEWAARNSAKPERTGPEAWVVQAGPEWSRAHLEQEGSVIVAALLAALAARLGASLPPTLTVSAHRWRYAKSGNAAVGPLWDPTRGLGLCGDWLLGPRVESAWLSGDRLAGAVGGA